MGDEIDAVGCFLEYLYTGDYFPKKLPGQRLLESDPSLPAVDETGEQLLKHARVYTIAEKFGMDKLKSLASSKIHCVNSTAKGEITYARYIYQYTSKEDTTVRAPVANFWATRSHTLRAEAEDEFRSLCLEFPQFGYDVLSKFLLFPPPSRPFLVAARYLLMKYIYTDINLFFSSSCSRREAEARAKREDDARHRAQTAPTQQRIVILRHVTTRTDIHSRRRRRRREYFVSEPKKRGVTDLFRIFAGISPF